MYPVRKRDLFPFAAAALAALPALGSFGYLELSRAGLKSSAELLLFVALLAFLLCALLAVRLALSARRLRSELEKISFSMKVNGELPANRLRKLGWFGETIKGLCAGLEESGARKSERIAALSATVRTVLMFVDSPVLLIDPAGRITGASSGFAKDLKSPLQDKQSLESILPGLRFAETLSSAERLHAPVEARHDSGTAVIYPVYSMRNELGCLVADLSPQKGFRKTALPDASAGEAPRGDKAKKSILARLFGKNKK